MSAHDYLGVSMAAAGLIGIAGAVAFVFDSPADDDVTGARHTKDAETSEQGMAASGDPGAVDDALIAHIKAGRYADAYALTSAAYRASVPLARFAAAMRANVYLQSSDVIGCHDLTTYERTIHVRRCVLRSKRGNVDATLHFVAEQGQWRMTGIVLGGTPAFPTPELDAGALR